MTDQQQPLWKVLHETFLSDVGEIDLGDGYGTISGDPDAGTWASMIEALADWLVPEEPKPVHDMRIWCYCWSVRRGLRQRLLDEARRAREGQGDV